MDQTGTPIGDPFMVNHAQFAGSTEQFDISLIAPLTGSVDVEYCAPSELFINDVAQYTGYRAGIHADGSLGNEDILGSGYGGTFSSNVNYTYGFYLASPDDLADLLTRALDGTGVDTASVAGVLAAISAINARSTLSGTDLLRAEAAVAMTAKGGLANALAEAGSAADYHAASLVFTGANLDAAIAVNLAQVGNVDGVACNSRGTLIATEGCEVPVEALAIGDRVVTRDGSAKPIRWIGHRSYAGRFLAANQAVQPIRFHAGSLGNGLPRRDLSVSPEHAMLLDGLLTPARCLIDGSTIVRDYVERVDYLHVELDGHDILLAEGAASESFIDDSSRGAFHNAAEFATLYPDAPPPGAFCAPRVECGEQLDAIRRRLAGAGVHAVHLGHKAGTRSPSPRAPAPCAC